MLLDPGESSLRRHYNPSPLIDSAGGRGLALYRFVALVYAGILVGIHQEHVIRWWPILLWGACALVWSVVAPFAPGRRRRRSSSSCASPASASSSPTSSTTPSR
ncbi:hypothetical protein ON003_16710 [Janibacter hoylei]|uniref:hypothetical protein n=1 Tax=Janibacter hoylei TaxID=364298 RepID=UPI0022380381|nr:hypothetical protein [Janibacter hoylei]MCW4603054.1 hypothetical protein [Janibacter hoylei]